MATATTLTPTSATTSESPKLVRKTSTTDVKTPTTPTQTSFGCQHVKRLLQEARQPAVDGYTRVIASIRQQDNFHTKTFKSNGGPAATGQTTYLCLQCPNVSSSSKERHHKNHAFAVESENGFVFCHECKDFVYDPTFEELRSSTSKKRKHFALQPDDKRLVAAHTSTTSCAATGLRGLYNMGQTCFMSVVLQSLIHNPLVRAYYLSEGHRRVDCEREACTSCALDELFIDFFGQEKHEGYGAVHMLQGCWMGGGGLAGYSQQDAHEYLNFLLNSLHTANTEADEEEDDGPVDGSKATKDNSNDCDCVIHQTFFGQSKSTVTCTTCNNTTTSLEAFMDLSLDIKNSAVTVVKKKKQPLTNSTTTIKEVIPMDLTECLDRYTATETLSTYHCNTCASSQPTEKRLSLVRLPPVIPVHLKRFSHSKSSQQSNKIDTRIRFPLELDMSPYLAKSAPTRDKIKDKDKDKTDLNSSSTQAQSSPQPTGSLATPPIYILTSVVVHKGKIDNGHYISYARQLGDWFRFDDSMVVQVSEREVLRAEAYMLFYTAKEFEVLGADEER